MDQHCIALKTMATLRAIEKKNTPDGAPLYTPSRYSIRQEFQALDAIAEEKFGTQISQDERFFSFDIKVSSPLFCFCCCSYLPYNCFPSYL
jgi:hypothetical protein